MKRRMISLVLGMCMMVSLMVGCSQKPEQMENEEKNATENVGSTENAGGESEDASQSADSGDSQDASNDAAGKKYEGITLSFMSNIAGVQSEAMEEVIAQFEAETGASVEYSSPGASYEELMKTKMAANQLPDLFTTHGWSIARYGQYLEPLNGQEWFSRLSESAKQIVVEQSSGNIYCLPVDVDVAGIIYNKTVLEAAGVNVDDLKTWDAFAEALGKVKDAGYTPIHIGGKDNWTIGQFFDWVAPSYLITDEGSNHRDALKDGSFDWSNWKDLAQMMADWKAAGYFNTDCLTADYNAQIKAMAEDKVAFEFLGNSAVTEMQSVNPDVSLGLMSVPASSDADEPTLIGGERIAIGVWKDSANKEAALELLSYFAQDENMKKVASADGAPASFDGVESDTGIITEDLAKYMAQCRIFPYFDREYLPNGMWDDMCITGASILAEDSGAVDNACTAMQESYKAKLEVQ